MAKTDPHVAAHLEWLGFIQPAGLVVSAMALARAGAVLESAGWMDFPVAAMLATAGRPLCAALRLLLSEQRLLALPRAAGSHTFRSRIASGRGGAAPSPRRRARAAAFWVALL